MIKFTQQFKNAKKEILYKPDISFTFNFLHVSVHKQTVVDVAHTVPFYSQSVRICFAWLLTVWSLVSKT